MKKLELFYIKNQMLAANGLANFIGVFLVSVLLLPFRETSTTKTILETPVGYWMNALFSPFAFVFVATMTLLYERPIRSCLNAFFKGDSPSPELELKARQRLLNEPFVLIALDLCMWLLASISWASIHLIYASGSQFQDSLYGNLSVGLITVTVAFFLLEFLLQKGLAPYFFPGGGLSAIPKTLRIKIRTRLIALLFACNLIPLLNIILILKGTLQGRYDPVFAIDKLQSAISINVFTFIGGGICLTLLVSRNLSAPFQDIIQTLRWIRNGRFDKKVTVFSNDEIGYTGDTINEMINGLIEREKMQQSLNLAKEVQQNLLPQKNVKINGYDIAGKSVYCDETGGDYYDFIVIDNAGEPKIGVAVGDVSGHGIPSALLMATVRSSLRQRISLPGSIARVISDVNRQLVKDVEDSGQFMTLFFLMLDTSSRQLEWVRAGHDPGISYDPDSDSFSELAGSGIALGVDSGWNYVQYRRNDFSNGQIIFLSTDGIWEARNQKGEMFGKAPILNAIRRNASSDAAQIINAIFNELNHFLGDMKIEDDVTSVVIKIS